MAQAPTRRLSFRWNGRAVEAREGDTVAAALYANGIRLLARSRKRHRPQGLSGSFIGPALGRVDGRPNVRLDLEPVREGLEARIQNVWPCARFDLLALAQLLPARRLYAGFEHEIDVRNGSWLYRCWEHLLAFLAGMADPPDPGLSPDAIAGRRLKADTVVIGGGPAGCAAANEAAQRGERVLLVTRGDGCARFARLMAAPAAALDPRVECLTGMEAFGLYRRGRFVACAPLRHDHGAAVIEAGRVVLATGQRSCPPIVPGNNLPGVLDAHAAMTLASVHGVAPGRAVFVVGTGAEVQLAERLRVLGVTVVGTAPVRALRRIQGRREVTAVETDRLIACDCVVHAGPWRGDSNLRFQADSEGLLQLQPAAATSQVRLVGADASEPVMVGSDRGDAAMVCACMDVSTGELARHVEAGETDVEVLKRLTACGMGPCQGTPCWDMMAASLATLTGAPVENFGRPSYRDPRRAITVAQAAGLDGLLEPER
ncbi:2Fe-2S iron-sulfur cluster-binding protein [Hypericibacter sp.]|uniref:2Fe-2S iron-sulfur cluster-binding protein n=1 Tax=Hypericibacter sp. TaxID=2705401 RepID=UPI003D6CF48B